MTILPTVRDLYILYELYNKQYFQSRLPSRADVTIEYSNRLTASAGLCYPQKRLIRLSKHYHGKYPEEAPLTLLHEMIHLLVPNHGTQFKMWVERIKQMGGNVETRAKERATPSAFRWQYICVSCNCIYLRKRRLGGNGTLFRCSHCYGKLAERALV
jgi:predicted SprT family Zn-dependent metalloprotease